MQSLALDMEKEMEKYVVRNFADILRVLREHPEWLEELRKVILTSELLELPKKVDELLTRVGRLEKDVGTLKQDVTILKQDVAVLKQDVAVLKQDVAILKQDVAILKQDVAILKQDVAILKEDVAILKQDVAYLKGEVGRLKGNDFERRIREKYYAYFGRILKKAKLIPFEEILPILDDAEDRKEITLEQRDAVLRLDVLISGQIRELGKDVVLAVEVSYSLYPEDLERAFERAQVLATILHKEVIPTVVACEATEDIQKKADERGILLIKVEY